LCLEEGRVVVTQEDTEIRGGDRDGVTPIEEVLDGGVEGGEIELPRLARPLPVGLLPVEGLDIPPVVVVGLEREDLRVVVVEGVVVEVEVTGGGRPLARDAALVVGL